jgi:nicotinamidase-related amidase
MSGPLSIVSRDTAALIVIDVQERLAAVMERRAAMLDAAGKLARTASIVGVPVVATRQNPAGLGDVEPVLRSTLEAIAATTQVRWVDKFAFDCFGEPAFVDELAELGRTQLVIAGMETHICVAQTVISALRAGFDVHVVADACCSRNASAHEIALHRLRSAGAVVTTTESAQYELVGLAGTDEFRALLRIVKE